LKKLFQLQSLYSIDNGTIFQWWLENYEDDICYGILQGVMAAGIKDSLVLGPTEKSKSKAIPLQAWTGP
jgi:hypothetical protein